MSEMNALDISEVFIRELLWPLLQHELPEAANRLAIAIVGSGSDVLGLDDQISQDHHWGPRANVMLLPEDKPALLSRLQKAIDILPDDFQSFKINKHHRNMTGVCGMGIDDFFRSFLGTDQLPETETDWLQYCEVDLLHVTAGRVVIDGPDELTKRRKTLAYYPEMVWKKRIADWCMYITGRDAPYNLNRMAKRNDRLSSMMYEAMYYKQVMELCFTLNRQYAPYTKWLNRLFRQLPRFGPEIAPCLDAIAQEQEPSEKVLKMVDVNYMIADALADLGLTTKAKRQPFDPGLTDLTLYDNALQIYKQLPQEMLRLSFNRIESWEWAAREVVLSADDYFQERIKNK
jgi:hypothetical protein